MENKSAKSSQSDVKVTGKKTKGASQNAPDYEVLKTHYLEREMTSKELKEQENLLEEDSNELGSLKYIHPDYEPDEDDFNLSQILTAGIVVGILAVLLLVFLCLVWNQWYRIGFVMWSFLVLFVTADTLFISYFIQRNRFIGALENFPMLLARKKELEDSVETLSDSTKRLWKQNIASLYFDVKDYFCIPLPNLVVNEDNYDYWTRVMYDFMVVKEKIGNEENENKRNELQKELSDKKLETFYDISIKEEAGSESSYNAFQTQLHSARESKDFNLLRFDNGEFESKHSKYITSLSSELSTDIMTPLLDELNKLKEIDTDNFLGITSVDKLKEKTEKIEKIYKKARSEYKKLDRARKQINSILEYVRLCAYRNIYLGVEMINFIYTAGAGGRSLTTRKDSLQLGEINANVEAPTEITVNVMDSISGSLEAVGEIMFSSKEALEFSMDYPELAIGAVAVGAIVNYFENRKIAIDGYNRATKQMVENMSKIEKGYTSGKASIRRAVEIIKAIDKANKGFMHIYSPLREKVFENGDLSSVTMPDLKQIFDATNEYNKIASSKL